MSRPAHSAVNMADIALAERFLTFLDESAETWTFQTFDDDKERLDRNIQEQVARGVENPVDLFAKIYQGTLKQHFKTLAALNAQRIGVFITVNETDGKGRSGRNIRRIRAGFIDLDGAPLQAVLEGPLAPHIIVASSPGKFHVYWRLADCPLEHFKTLQKGLIARFGSDNKVHDLSRVMRLPGFYHGKAETPSKVVILEDEPGVYTFDEFITAFQIKLKPEPESKSFHGQPASGHLGDKEVARILEALQHVPADDYQIWLEIGMALHATGTGQQALDMWSDWSERSDKFSQAMQRQKWASFDPNHQPKITLATLFKRAREYGWTPRHRPEEATFEVFGERINKTDDFEELTGDIAPAVAKSDLNTAEKTKLLRQIAKKAGISYGDLRKALFFVSAPAGEQPENFIRELNAKHAIVPVGGRVLILNREFDPNLNRPLLTFSNRQDFQLRYSNRSTYRNREPVDIGNFWLSSPDRRQYDGIVFSPGHDVPGYYNLFQGWGVAPASGGYGRFHDLIHDVICSGNDETFNYVWCWLAHLFQRPAELPGTALVLRGGQGTGKNTFVDTLGRLVGHQHYIVVNSLQQVTGRFSGHLADALLVYANEAIWGGDKNAEGALKAMITDPIATIERKGKDAVSMPNFKRLIVASNEDWAVPRGMDDRRFVVLEVSECHKQDRDYFSSIRADLDNGGYAALMQALLQVELADWRPTPIPEALTREGWDLKIKSGSSVMQWWFHCLDNAVNCYVDSTLYWADSAIKIRVHQFYMEWCKSMGFNHPIHEALFGKEMKRWGIVTVRNRDDGRKPRFVFPTVEEARKLFSEAVSIPKSVFAEDDDG